MIRFDTVIKGGTVVDGARMPRYKADVGIKDGIITEIGHIEASDGKRTIDASGLIVAPGFIDLHTHYDAQLFWDPYCSISSWHGHINSPQGNISIANNKDGSSTFSSNQLHFEAGKNSIDCALHLKQEK